MDDVGAVTQFAVGPAEGCATSAEPRAAPNPDSSGSGAEGPRAAARG